MGSSVKQCSIWLVQVWCIHDAPPCSDGRAPGRQKQTWANDIRTFCSIRRRSSEIAGMGRNLADWRCSERHRKNATQPEMFPIRSDSWSALGAYPATGSVVQLRNLDDFVAAICGIQQNAPRNLAKKFTRKRARSARSSRRRAMGFNSGPSTYSGTLSFQCIMSASK